VASARTPRWAPIKNPSRTQLSLVVHTIPKGVPVFYMDVFFSPAQRVQNHVPWSYSMFEGRHIAETGPMSIGMESTMILHRLLDSNS
jgi:hypothetical protein